MAIIASTGKSRNALACLRRTMESAWWGKDVSIIEAPPDALNNVSLTSVNAAGTGTVELIKADASNVVPAPNGLTIPAGKMFSNLGNRALTALSADGAIDPHTSKTYVVTKASAAALTLAAPTATTDDGVEITVTSNTAYAHAITATGLFQCGTVKTDVGTFAAFAGSGVRLIAYQGKWNVLANVVVTFT